MATTAAPPRRGGSPTTSGGWWSRYDGIESPTRSPRGSISLLWRRPTTPGSARPTARLAAASTPTWTTSRWGPRALNELKGAKDAAEWEPAHNQCWFAGRVLAVKLEYGLTVDPPEADGLEAMLEGCRIKDVLRPYRPEPYP